MGRAGIHERDARGEAGSAIYIARDFDEKHELPVILLDSCATPVPDRRTDEYLNTALLVLALESELTSLAPTPTVSPRLANGISRVVGLRLNGARCGRNSIGPRGRRGGIPRAPR